MINHSLIAQHELTTASITRPILTTLLTQVLTFTIQRFIAPTTTTQHRMQWARIAIQVSRIINDLLHDQELEIIKTRIQHLEAFQSV
jgi:hypothetical protein